MQIVLRVLWDGSSGIQALTPDESTNVAIKFTTNDFLEIITC